MFDFDGLLVNTEDLHRRAYIILCQRRGYNLQWSLDDFYSIAHSSSEGIKNEILRLFPSICDQEDWASLYVQKLNIYLELLAQKELCLFEGVSSFIGILKDKGIKMCVVTNAKKEQVDLVKQVLPSLNDIPHWITRECYHKPKPDPECYQLALSLKESHEKAVGFEDSIRGYRSMQMAGVDRCVLICPFSHPQMKLFSKEDTVEHFSSFQNMLSHFLS
ncbi:MAG: HAD family hydrolase [Rhabdochlamydiaceae bacterium]